MWFQNRRAKCRKHESQHYKCPSSISNAATATAAAPSAVSVTAGRLGCSPIGSTVVVGGGGSGRVEGGGGEEGILQPCSASLAAVGRLSAAGAAVRYNVLLNLERICSCGIYWIMKAFYENILYYSG